MLGQRVRGVKYRPNDRSGLCQTNASSDLSYMSATISDGALTVNDHFSSVPGTSLLVKCSLLIWISMLSHGTEIRVLW